MFVAINITKQIQTKTAYATQCPMLCVNAMAVGVCVYLTASLCDGQQRVNNRNNHNIYLLKF